MDKNLAVYYSGASGGCFFALTLALATQKTHSISSTQTVQEIIDNNWQSNDYDKWDDRQVKYDHNYGPDCVDLRSKDRHKRCNDMLAIIKYDDFNSVVDEDAISLMVYTDIDTQFALMELKKRYLFFTGTDPHRNANIVMNNNKFPLLPDKDWHKQFKDTFSKMYNGVKIFNDHIKCVVLDRIDHAFLLQDVVSTKFKCVTDVLGLEHSTEVADHVDTWVSLHPLDIQSMLQKRNA
jgi:hypothetical protein